jgi:hypothetical protein
MGREKETAPESFNVPGLILSQLNSPNPAAPFPPGFFCAAEPDESDWIGVKVSGVWFELIVREIDGKT